tara:strand:+ start:1353 stop:2021 length:669 start_codon:yes stop_codon:yes gene_type:complete
MLWPTLVVDDFFKNVDAVIDYSKTLKFFKTDGKYPGERTKPLHVDEENFFKKVTSKIIACYYPNELQSPNLRWTAVSYFQKIKTKDHANLGFVHQDRDEAFTSIVYLTEEENTGTSLYRLIKESNKTENYVPTKIKGYLNTKHQKSKKFKNVLKENLNSYQKTLEFTPLKNRMIMFDGSQYHAASSFGKKQKERLTLITFFKNVYFRDGTPLKYHLNECYKI